eukprot:GFUD01048759.1.p1 GENE.GFUD01048759.1~~GFUD01048759.1.p1  ORF type:complete len:106 (-),score=30.14 GFUD01048759.1:410-727(-)
MLCGGTNTEQEATPEVQALVEQVKEDVIATLGQTSATLEASHFKTQVVAGTNYFVRVHIGDDKYVHLRIYKHFSGSVELHGVRHGELGGVGAQEELVYFDQNIKK